jgi:hypothetical protein
MYEYFTLINLFWQRKIFWKNKYRVFTWISGQRWRWRVDCERTTCVKTQTTVRFKQLIHLTGNLNEHPIDIYFIIYTRCFFFISYFVGYEHYDICNVLFGFTHFEITILNELICSVNLKNFGKIIRYIFVQWLWLHYNMYNVVTL